jgi:uncharacterized protein (TIGR03437 family)
MKGMKGIANPLGKMNWRKRVRAVCVLCATTAMALSAQTFTTLHSFGYTDGAYPEAGLIQATDGNFYGTTNNGGASSNCNAGCGTIFKIDPSGALTTLYSFCAQPSCADGSGPTAALVQATDGNFYGTTGSGGTSGYGTIFKITPSGALTTLYSFGSQSTDGAGPSGLIQATDRNFYGTTGAGGSGVGTVFKITPSGTLTTIYSFGYTDGAGPSGLIQATDGNFYGTTFQGGTYTYGTIFKITPNGTLTTLYSFCPDERQCRDGAEPSAGLVQATDGDFYGTTSAGGGASACAPFLGCGSVFKINQFGFLMTLHSFGYTDGAQPFAPLVQATDGNFYGTTSAGGSSTNCASLIGPAGGCGTFFKITPNWMLTTLYSFCPERQCTDGNDPIAGLLQATDGDLYGTTRSGGLPNSYGTVFSLSVGPGPHAPAVNAGGVLNSGSYTTQGVAPGSIVSIFGTNLAGATASASAIPLPTALSDVTSVTFNGIPAGLYFVSEKQINAQLPFDVVPSSQGGTVNIVVTRSSGTSAPQSVTVVPSSPGIFTTTATGLGQAFAYDNTTVALAAPAGAGIGNLATAPISISSGHALIIACTGLGAVTPFIDNYVAASDGTFRYTSLQPTVLIGGVAAQPIYSVLSPQFVSEYQIGVTPAAGTPTGNAVSLQIQMGGVTTSNQVTIAVAQ